MNYEEEFASDYEVLVFILQICDLVVHRGERGNVWVVNGSPDKIVERGYVVSLVAESLMGCEREPSSENIMAIINLLKER